MTKEIEWRPDGAAFKADMPCEVTLYVCPDATREFGMKPKRGTTWRAGVSQWDGKFTISRFGRDEYTTKHASYRDAMRAAEAIYRDGRIVADRCPILKL